MITAHGLMFHHFHDDRHPPSQGSISQRDFVRILDYVSKKHTILSVDEWLRRAKKQWLEESDVCLTFDDNLRCQFDVAFPVLRERGLTAFWFIYTSPLENLVERLELYRYFRTVAFSSIDAFYDAFDEAIKISPLHDAVVSGLIGVELNSYLSKFPFYSYRDRWFRYLRDRILGQENYFSVMDQMIIDHGLCLDDISNLLWMDENHLHTLIKHGHALGLHSHTHPTEIHKLSPAQQELEYSKNRDILSKISLSPITSMSHPCGSYNEATLEILHHMGIEVGFVSCMDVGEHHPLKWPRQDHANILTAMKNPDIS